MPSVRTRGTLKGTLWDYLPGPRELAEGGRALCEWKHGAVAEPQTACREEVGPHGTKTPVDLRRGRLQRSST
eukprot:5698125-Pleurochrysis_carterae.AAC.1